jgi:hypothetical protein
VFGAPVPSVGVEEVGIESSRLVYGLQVLSDLFNLQSLYIPELCKNDVTVRDRGVM